MTDEQAKKLAYPFTAKEIEWRVLLTTKDKQKGQVAAYVDSRAIQNRLDTVLGQENWQNRFTVTSGNSTGLNTYVCELLIYYPERQEWLSKSDGAGSTDIEPVKGGLSNSFKRAASMWGIGRYLYELTGIWVKLKDGKYIADGEQEKIDACYERFLKQYLAHMNGKQTVSQPAQAPPLSAVKPVVPSPASGSRFSQGKSIPESTHTVSCKVIDLKVSRGERGTQTLVTYMTPEGEAISGYIKGEAPLQTGQSICNVRLIQKNSEIVGPYNIIEGYQLAA